MTRDIVARGVVRTCAGCGARNRVPASHLADTGRCGRCKSTLAAVDEPLDADQDLFAQITAEASVPVLVDFWAAWCGPCRVAAPAVKKVAAALAGKALVLKVDTDKHPALARRFEVMGIPNFVVLKKGRVVWQQAGVVGADELERRLVAAQRA